MLESMPPFFQALVPLCLWLAVLSAIFIPLERLAAAHPRRILRKEVATDLGYYFLNGLTLSVFMSAPIGLLAWAAHQVVPAAFLDAIASLSPWARMPLALIVGEVGYYWGHRWTHEVAWLWRFHAIHHSAEAMDFLTNTRAHPVDLVFTRLCALAPLYILGLSGPSGLEGSWPAFAVLLFGTVWGFYVHANLSWRFGPLERLIATPAFHHWHHVRSGPRNKNYASVLPWLDGLFGTLHLPDRFPDDYGISKPMPGALVDQIVHPFFPSPTPGRPATSPEPEPERARQPAAVPVVAERAAG